MKSFFAKKTYLERDDPKLFKKIAEYLTWVKRPKSAKPKLEEPTEEVINLLPGENRNQNENEIADKIVMEEQKENNKLRKLPNQIEVDGYSLDRNDESVIFNSHSDNENGDQFLGAGDFQTVSEDIEDPKHRAIRRCSQC